MVLAKKNFSSEDVLNDIVKPDNNIKNNNSLSESKYQSENYLYPNINNWSNQMKWFKGSKLRFRKSNLSS